MAIDKTKIAQNAQKLVQKGALDKAIKEYQKLVEADPKDIRSLLKIAELYGKLNQTAEAVATFKKVAEQYNKNGFYTKAVAVLRQAVEVDPKAADLYLLLADLQQKLGLMRDALLQLNTAAKIYQDDGKHDRALQMLERMRELDPEDPSVQARFGEALFNAGQRDRAIEIFRGLIETLKRSNSNDDLIRFCERILTINPDDVESLRELSRAYIRVGLANKALLKMKALFDRGIMDAELYDLLDRAYMLLGKEDKAIHAQVEKAKYYVSHQQPAEARKTFEAVLARDPGNAEATAYMQAAAPAAPAPKPAPAAPAPAPKPAPQTAPPPPPMPPATGPRTPVSGTYGNQNSKQLSKFLTEADVYLKYGLRDKAIEQLEGVLQHDANNISARLKLVDVYAEESPAKAATHLRALAEISESLGELDQAQTYLDRADKLAPAAPAPSEEVAPEPVIGGEAAVDDEISVDVDFGGESDDDGAEVVIGGETEAEEFGGFGDDLGDELSGVLGGDDDLLGDGDFGGDGDPGVLGIDDEGGPSLREQLEEAEFYIQQNLFDEARELFDRILARHPGNAQATERLAWILAQSGASPAPKAPAAAPAAPAADEAEEPLFDLAAELEDELDFGEEHAGPAESEEPPSFEDIFTQFKKGVERELKDDTAAHYDLGIAYKEMGLVNDAIGEFEIAMKDSARECDCSIMIALSHQQLGDNPKAIEFYQRALASPSCTPEAALNTNYELACLFETTGDIKNAVAHFKKVVDQDKTYRDVGDRIRALKARVQSGKAYA